MRPYTQRVASLFRAAKRHLPRPVGDWLRVRRRDAVRLGTGVDIHEVARQVAVIREEMLGDLEQRTLDLLARQDVVLASYDRRVAALVNRVLDLEERLGGQNPNLLEAVLAPHHGRSSPLAAQARVAFEPNAEERKLLEERIGRHVGVLRDHTPVLDVGGGLPLTVLHAAGVAATGVDGDPVLDLARRPEASAGAVTLVGLIERLELDDVDRLLRGVHRVLRSGGLVVVEASYPTSAGSLARFWRDPARLRPWDASTMEWLIGHAGFTPVDVRAHPGTDADYALIAQRP